MTAFGDIVRERDCQDKQWGEQNWKPLEWFPILSEEVGEVGKALAEGLGPREFDAENYREELVQVAAVAIAAIQAFDRGHV